MSAPVRSTLVLGMDAAWGGLGVCAALNGKPLATFHRKFGPANRMPLLHQFLAELARWVAELRQLRGPEVQEVLVVVERPPDVYAGRGNQASVGGGLGELRGALCYWTLLQHQADPTWSAEVWQVPTVDHATRGPGWRPWWIPGGHGNRVAHRTEWKAWALARVDDWGWSPLLACAERRGAQATETAREDVAEAILIAVGASTRVHLMPGRRRAA